MRPGLAAEPDRQVACDVERLARALVAEFGTKGMARARDVAQAQIDLHRVRDVRVKILDRRASGSDANASSPGGHDIAASLAELVRLHRYERRAFSKWEKVLRALVKDVEE